MKKSVLIIALTGLLAVPAFAQWPAGTPREDTGSRPSQMGNPTPQETVETHKDHEGRVVTEDGRLVEQRGDEKAESERSTRHSHPGGANDPASDPGTLE